MLEPRDMKDTALGVHLVKLKAARFGDAQEAVGNITQPFDMGAKFSV
jgi:hypothetical protein